MRKESAFNLRRHSVAGGAAIGSMPVRESGQTLSSPYHEEVMANIMEQLGRLSRGQTSLQEGQAALQKSMLRLEHAIGRASTLPHLNERMASQGGAPVGGDDMQPERSLSLTRGGLPLMGGESSSTSTDKSGPARSHSIAGGLRNVWPWTLPQGWPAALSSRPELDQEFDMPASDPDRPGMEYMMDGAFMGYALEDESFRRPSWDSGMGMNFSSMHRWSTSNKMSVRVGRLLLHPVSKWRLLIDAMAVLILLYDLIVIPVVIAWDLPMVGTLRMGGMLVATFWTVDIGFSFCTAYFKSSGELELQPREVALHYLKTWFMLDIFLVVLDWVSIIIAIAENGALESSQSAGSGMLRFTKASRIIRIAAVLRCTRFTDILTKVLDQNLPGSVRMALQIIQLMVLILYANHVLACVWFFIATNLSSDTGLCWLDKPIVDLDSDKGAMTYRDSSFVFQYLTALHWSMTQMTPGSMQVFPVNTAERIVNCACLLAGVLCFGSLISTLSSKMLHYRMVKAEEIKNFNQLRRFLGEKHISPDLTLSVQRQVRERTKISKPLMANDVLFLSILSVRLRTALQSEICEPHLNHHPFFNLAMQLQSDFLYLLCSRMAVDFSVLEPGDLLFEPGLVAVKTYLVVQGAIKYTQTPSTSLVDGPIDLTLSPGAWICEWALWCKWIHTGTAEASAVCELLTIDVVKVLECCRQRPVTTRVAREYAHLRRNELEATDMTEGDSKEYPNDAQYPKSSIASILEGMSLEVRCTMAYLCFCRLRDTWSWILKRPLLEELVAEVKRGQSIMLFGEGGEVQRLVSIVSLRLAHPDGRILVQLAKVNESAGPEIKLEPVCQLPGTKLKPGETAADAIQRMLHEEFLPLAPGLQLGDAMTEDVSILTSRRYRLMTRYATKVQPATLANEYEMPALACVTTTRNTVARTSSTSAAYEEMLQRQALGSVRLLSDGRSTMVYTFLTTEEFARLSSDKGRQMLEQWVSSMEVTEEDTRTAAQIFSACQCGWC